jgi:hypothetical protein
LFCVRVLSVAIVCLLPFVILAAFVPARIDAAEPDVDKAAADARFDAIYTTLTAITTSDRATIRYKEQLIEGWKFFGGATLGEADGIGDSIGAYYSFYWAELYPHGGTVSPETFRPYLDAKAAFMEFYGGKFDESGKLVRAGFTQIMKPYPKILVKSKHFNAFTGGVEELYTLFSDKYDTARQLDDARDKMTKVRQKTHFRLILEDARDIFITPEQQAKLQADMANFELKRGAYRLDNSAGLISDAQYVSFDDMVVSNLSWKISRFVEENEPKVGGFHGFGPYEKEVARAENIRIEYLFDRDEFAVDYARAPSGMAFGNPFTIAAPTKGTSQVDFVFNAIEIAWPMICALVLALVYFSIFWDIRAHTVIGAIASPHSRRSIIWSKFFTSFIAAAVMIIGFTCVMWFLASIIIGSTAAPPILAIVLGDAVVQVSQAGFLILAIVGLLFRVAALIAFAGFLSVISKNKAFTPVFGALFLVALVCADVFLKVFVAFNFFVYPALLVLTGLFFYFADRKFYRREFI